MSSLILSLSAPWAGTAHAAAPSPWAVGVSVGLGVRDYPKGQVPDTFAPRAELLVLQARYSLPGVPFTSALPWPSRLEVQLDWVQRWASEDLSTRPRMGAAAYATWLRPWDEVRSAVLSPGLCVEWGHDSFVVNEALTQGPGGTLALAGRVGLEKPRRWSNTMRTGFYLSGAVGVSLGSDPNQPSPTRYTRLSLERSWSWSFTDARSTPLPLQAPEVQP